MNHIIINNALFFRLVHVHCQDDLFARHKLVRKSHPLVLATSDVCGLVGACLAVLFHLEVTFHLVRAGDVLGVAVFSRGAACGSTCTPRRVSVTRKRASNGLTIRFLDKVLCLFQGGIFGWSRHDVYVFESLMFL